MLPEHRWILTFSHFPEIGVSRYYSPCANLWHLPSSFYCETVERQSRNLFRLETWLDFTDRDQAQVAVVPTQTFSINKKVDVLGFELSGKVTHRATWLWAADKEQANKALRENPETTSAPHSDISLFLPPQHSGFCPCRVKCLRPPWVQGGGSTRLPFYCYFIIQAGHNGRGGSCRCQLANYLQT